MSVADFLFRSFLKDTDGAQNEEILIWMVL